MRRSHITVLGLTLILGSAVPNLRAQSSAPQAYTLTETSYLTEVSMFSGQVSNLKIHRARSKEVVELTIAPWGAEPKGIHQRYLFDFQAHKAYIQDFSHNVCTWKNYVSARAPVNYDPITSFGPAERAQMTDAKQHTVGTENVNGIPASITENVTPDGKIRMWLAQKGDFPVKMTLQTPDGKLTTMMEVKQVEFGSPAASLFVPPTNCTTQSQGDWSDTQMSAHAEAQIEAQASGSANLATGETHGQATAKMQQVSPSAGSAASGESTGEEFVDSQSVFEPSKNTCTVLFRMVRAETMEPITNLERLELDTKDVKVQYRGGILRIPNAPSRFRLDYQQINGPGGMTELNRQCFHPETVLMLKSSEDFVEHPDKWLWVKSGKYATIAPVAASRVTQPAGQPVPKANANPQVTDVQLTVEPKDYSGPCPVKVKLTGTFTADAAGTAYFQFQAGAVAANREGTVTVDAAGTQTVTSEGMVRRTPQVQSVRFLAGMEPRGHQENAKYTDVDLNISCSAGH